jgi:hypothetical protein
MNVTEDEHMISRGNSRAHVTLRQRPNPARRQDPMHFGQSSAQRYHLSVFGCRGFDRNLIVHRPCLPQITVMAINRATAEDPSLGSTGFTQVAFPITMTLPCEVMPMQMGVSLDSHDSERPAMGMDCTRTGDPGVTAADNRLFVEAVLWIAPTGSPSRDLPDKFGK